MTVIITREIVKAISVVVDTENRLVPGSSKQYFYNTDARSNTFFIVIRGSTDVFVVDYLFSMLVIVVGVTSSFPLFLLTVITTYYCCLLF